MSNEAWMRSQGSPERRYWLTRHIPAPLGAEPGEALMVVMLNPSTATDTEDDPTIRRLIGFAERFGCDELHVANLYSLRSTDPANLWTHDEPADHLADEALNLALNYADPHHSGRLVCAWGANARQDRVDQFLGMLEPGDELWCLGTTKAGAPRHPLYLRADTDLQRWP